MQKIHVALLGKKKNYSFSVDLSGGETGDLGDGGAPGEDGDHQE